MVDVREGIGGQERSALWRLRHGVRDRYVRRSHGRNILSIDVSVPISGLVELVSFVDACAVDSGLDLPVLGHAGDGNIHLGIIFDPADAEVSRRVSTVGQALVNKAIDLGGTSTGEHGIGLGKRGHLVAEFGADTVEAMRSIKLALDPNNILNPGKVLP